MTHEPNLPYPTILRAVVGSTVHGLNVEDGIEDRDEMGICVEDYQAAHGLLVPFEQYIYRSAAIREGRPDAKSYAGDLDLVVYSLRKWLRLALNGNPTILLLLFAPPLQQDTRGAQLRDLAPKIVSRRAGRAFLGYLDAQRARLTGERGGKDVNRPELVERYGFDTKYALHMLRLGYQGVELMETGRLSLPMREPDRSWLRSVRTGGATLPEVLDRATELRTRLETLLETSPLPEHPDSAAAERWMLETYWETWTTRSASALR
jgi:predicted nucleotidyltransferase